MKITLIAGARPNFMKIAPIIHAIHEAQKNGIYIQYRLVHTGQHYDKNMSDNFFHQLEIPKPDINLNAGGGSQAELTANIMIQFEKELTANPADIVIVVGDVTSTMACAIVTKKLNIKLAHVEGGIRSNDWTMPEEINRLVTDAITDIFFTTSDYANQNLLKSGIEKSKIHFVGNTMIDTLLKQKSRFKKNELWDNFNLKERGYIIITLHRPSNVDNPLKLTELLNEIIVNSENLPLIFPIHPRTKKILDETKINHPNLHIIDPLGYLEFNYLVEKAKIVITDSGGITEETTVLGVPCITLRENTERPETVLEGTNELIGTNPKNIGPALEKLFKGNWKKGKIPKNWDGNSAKRIIETLVNIT